MVQSLTKNERPQKSPPLLPYPPLSPVARAAEGAEMLLAVDEVGRGCIAGPVVVGASLWIQGSPAPWWEWVNDSKKLSPKKRAALFEACTHDPALFESFHGSSVQQLSESKLLLPWSAPLENTYPPAVLKLTEEHPPLPFPSLRCTGVSLGVGSVSEVDDLGIRGALNRAAIRALVPLVTPQVMGCSRIFLIMDGNQPLPLPKAWAHVQQVCHVDADVFYKPVGLSSVVAKHWRDNWMSRYAEVGGSSGYGFGKHKGYGTREHYQRISEMGCLSDQHRRTFLKNLPVGLGRP